MSKPNPRRSKPKYDVDDLLILLHNMKISDKGFGMRSDVHKKWEIVSKLSYLRFLNNLGQFNISQVIYYSIDQGLSDVNLITAPCIGPSPMFCLDVFRQSRARSIPLKEMHQIVRIINNIIKSGDDITLLITNYCWK